MEFLIIINLTVEAYGVAGCIVHWLPACLEVDDGQPAVSEAQMSLFVDIDPIIIRTTVLLDMVHHLEMSVQVWVGFFI